MSTSAPTVGNRAASILNTIALQWAGLQIIVTDTSAGGKATASFTCATDGSTSRVGSSGTDPGQYLASIVAAAGNDYEINAIMASGTSFVGLTGAYDALSSAKTWSLTSNFSQGTFTGTANVTIREIADVTNSETRSLVLTATST